MLDLCSIHVRYSGDVVQIVASIAPEAHGLGVASWRDVHNLRMPQLGASDDDADRIRYALRLDAGRLCQQLAAAWNGTEPLF